LLDGQARGRRHGVGDLGAAEGEPEEEHGADEFAAHGDEVVADVVGDFVEEGQAQVRVVEVGVWVGGFGEGDCEAAALERGLGRRGISTTN
jgi:hypothetical protein